MRSTKIRPLPATVTNPALQEVLSASGLTFAEAAKTVAVGAENGITLTYGPTTVAHWFAGAVPRRSAVPFAVDDLRPEPWVLRSEATDLGWDHSPMTEIAGDPWHGDSVTWPTRGDMDRRGALALGVYSVAAVAVPAIPCQIISRSGPGLRAGPGDVARIRDMARRMADVDDLYGGGPVRPTLAAYLYTEVAPLLRGTTGNVRPDLFRAAAEMTYLAGWVAVDDGAASLGRRYYVEAVRLAEEAGDPLMRATALRSMAIQEIELGHPRHAVDLAEAAVAGISAGCPARTRAWVTGAHAEALAAARDGGDARRVLRHAERDLERADSLPEDAWFGGYRRESFEHQTGTLLASIGDLAEAETHLAASMYSRRSVERRTRALIGVRLARVQHRRKMPEAAAVTLSGLREDLEVVKSARVNRELAVLPRDLVPTGRTCGC